jgi:hypothetical protein
LPGRAFIYMSSGDTLLLVPGTHYLIIFDIRVKNRMVVAMKAISYVLCPPNSGTLSLCLPARALRAGGRALRTGRRNHHGDS